jgi:tetratricopeptide (TPR) repeat protein
VIPVSLLLIALLFAPPANAQAKASPTSAASRPTSSLTAADLEGLLKLAAETAGGGDSLEQLGNLQARAGDFDAAAATAKKLDGFELARVTGRVVAYRAARQHKTAAAELRRLNLGKTDGEVLDEVVLTLAEEGNLAEARAVAQMLSQGIYAGEAWLMIARASKQKADFDRAMSNFKQPPDGVTFGQVLEARAACGDVSGAIQQAEAAKNHGEREGALWRIARVQALAGDFDAAKATAGRIDANAEMLDSDQTWTCIAAASAAKGDVAGTKAALDRVRWALRKPRVTSVLAYAQAKAGNLPAAKETAAALATDARGKEAKAACFAYGMIAAALAEKGDQQGARAMLDEARKTALTIRKKPDRVDGVLLVLKGALVGPRAVETEGYANAE